MKNSIFNTARAVAPVSEILSTRKGLIAMSIQNDNRKMTVFNRLAEIAMQVKKMIKPAVATIAIGVALAGVMNTVTVDAQPLKVRNNGLVHLNQYALNNMIQLGFGQGNGNNPLYQIGQCHGMTNQQVFFYTGLYFGGYTSLFTGPMLNNLENYMFLNQKGLTIGRGFAETSFPNCKLDVFGDVYASGQKLTSDRRFKKDIKPLTEDFDKLSKLNSVKYKRSSEVLRNKLEYLKNNQEKYSENKTGYEMMVASLETQIKETNSDTTTRFGFIAQELRELYPELI